MPTDEQRGLWAAIRSNPLDDTPRLIYADWLQENGDEARAEFIRLQCQIAQLPDDRKTQRKVLPALRYRENVLSTAHCKRWAEPIFRALTRPGPGVTLKSWLRSVQFRRGFITSLYLDLDGAHRVMTAGAEIEPLQDLVVTQGWERYNPKKLADVFAWEGVSCLARFSLAGATDNGVRTVVAGTTARLQYLTFHAGEITDAGAILLSEWRCAAELVSLHLSRHRIGDRGAEALANSPFLTGITELNLERNPIGHTARQRLIQRFGGNIILSPET